MPVTQAQAEVVNNTYTWNDGEWHTFRFTAYVEQNFILASIGQRGDSDWFDGEIRNVTFSTAALGTTHWALDQGSITTETPTVDGNGMGDITWSGVDASNWTVE